MSTTAFVLLGITTVGTLVNGAWLVVINAKINELLRRKR